MDTSSKASRVYGLRLFDAAQACLQDDPTGSRLWEIAYYVTRPQITQTGSPQPPRNDAIENTINTPNQDKTKSPETFSWVQDLIAAKNKETSMPPRSSPRQPSQTRTLFNRSRASARRSQDKRVRRTSPPNQPLSTASTTSDPDNVNASPTTLSQSATAGATQQGEQERPRPIQSTRYTRTPSRMKTTSTEASLLTDQDQHRKWATLVSVAAGLQDAT